jgi:hypothetical protein
MTRDPSSNGRQVTDASVVLDRARPLSGPPEPIFDAAGGVCAWMLPDRVVGRRGSTQAWLDGGLVYSHAGSLIGSVTDGVFRETDGAVTGYLAGCLDPACLPTVQSTPPEPPRVVAERRPGLRLRLARSGSPRNEWSTLSWAGFLLPRTEPPRRAKGHPSLSSFGPSRSVPTGAGARLA